MLRLLAAGDLPYRDFTYSYPPLFIYSLFTFYEIGTKLAALPIIVADALTAPLIYLMIKRTWSERLAVAASVVYIFSRFALVFEGISYLSEQPMLFFLLLSFVLLVGKKAKASAIALALGIMFKQDALFVLPVYVFWAV